MANLPDERDQNLSLLSALLAAEGDPWNFPALNRSAGRPSDRHKTLLVSLGSANGLQLDYGEVRHRLGDIFGAYDVVTKEIVFFERAELEATKHGFSLDSYMELRVAARAKTGVGPPKQKRKFGQYAEPRAVDPQVAAPMPAAATVGATVAALAAVSADPLAAGGGLCTCHVSPAGCPFAGQTHGSLSVWDRNRGYLARTIAASACYDETSETLFQWFLRSLPNPNRGTECVLVLYYPGRVGATWERASNVACFVDDVRLPARADGYYNNMSAAESLMLILSKVIVKENFVKQVCGAQARSGGGPANFLFTEDLVDACVRAFRPQTENWMYRLLHFLGTGRSTLQSEGPAGVREAIAPLCKLYVGTAS